MKNLIECTISSEVLCLEIRFVPPEGRYEAENEVETTYKILIPSNLQNYHLPRYRPIPEMLQLPVRDVFENNLSLSPSKQQMGVSFYPLQQVN